MSDRVDTQYKALRANFGRIERREWWLWASAFVITLLLTVALASFLLPGAYFHQDFTSQHMMSQAMRGLVALVFLFDLYTIYQHLLIHRIRRELVQRPILTHIFEPFFTTKERGKGTGLGLATVYGIVKQSNGYIWVDSAPGKGASFQIYLPLHVGHAAEETKSNAGEKLHGSEKILLVEDSEPLKKLAQRFLEAAGFRVLAAASGEEALEVAARYSGAFDLLLTDVIMPGMNGPVLAEQLSPRQPGMRVLYMSGYTDQLHRRSWGSGTWHSPVAQAIHGRGARPQGP